MKMIIILFVFAFISCCGNKATSKNDGHGDQVSAHAAAKDTLPGCLNKMIQGFKNEEIQNPPRKIFSYRYKGNTVYYVTAPCCDFFSDLYDSKCNLMGHPDGGITGRGDGRLPDFTQLRKNEILVWEDKRAPANKH